MSAAPSFRSRAHAKKNEPPESLPGLVREGPQPFFFFHRLRFSCFAPKRPCYVAFALAPEAAWIRPGRAPACARPPRTSRLSLVSR
ncbi:hypothetical protein B8V81_0551 [Paenibacillus pasadenensis]|uniref:Uncharacterized protein n=1 Tax=Paenibacillus pasadenensis TaxID=217090 RepID=A0A2N5NDJ7_9BACL|nr:hypothetical protein B8V81_0551 [Paenibacillus pasadenensis]